MLSRANHFQNDPYDLVSDYLKMENVIRSLIAKCRMLFIVFIGAALLQGCVAMQAQKDISATQQWCSDRTLGDEEIKPIYGKLPIVEVTEITIDMMSLDAVPTDDEVKAIKALFYAQVECSQKIRSVIRKYDPGKLGIFETIFHKYDVIGAELINKRISYGNANRLLKEAYLSGMNQLSDQIQRDIEQARALEMDRSRMLLQAGIEIQRSTNANRARFTNCNWLGSSLNCSHF